MNEIKSIFCSSRRDFASETENLQQCTSLVMGERGAWSGEEAYES